MGLIEHRPIYEIGDNSRKKLVSLNVYQKTMH